MPTPRWSHPKPQQPSLQVGRLRSLVREQQNQLALLRRSHAQLREEGEALRECLEASGALPPARFLARLHSRRFAELLQRHPGPWPGSLPLVINTRELGFEVATLVGSAFMEPLMATNRSMLCSLSRLRAQYAASVPAKIYALGGASERKAALSSVESFNPCTGQWEPVAPLLQARESCAAAACNGRLYVIGGVSASFQCLQNVEIFTPAARQWSVGPSLRAARSVAAATAAGGYLYALGGRDSFNALSSIERLKIGKTPADASNGQRWTVFSTMEQSRYGLAAAAVGRHLYAIGGKADWSSLNSNRVERLNTQTGRWDPVANMGSGRYRAAAVAMKGHLYVVGGCDLPWQAAQAERFDAQAGVWTALPAMQVARWGGAAVSLGTHVCVLGGRSSREAWPTAQAEYFDEVAGLWRPLGAMLTPRKFCAAAVCRA
eukprot:TRINITY_DN51573_c0_g1_i1.p1 TRINITY_DN51573_c0_g1~~TRINITY_DN51573_c0_g1_i1.p1  ORF type:complete len:434 (+),score=89.81 TRINITY_DN51573_c0_g1_i1:165-1466(+)